MRLTGRFAPSPSGRMHLGNVYAALISWLLARRQNGSWILRIEDLDRQRCKKEYADFILDDLHWLGLDWDGEVCFQSERDALYLEAFKKLEEEGLVYDCFCRRADLLASSAPHSANSALGMQTASALSRQEPLYANSPHGMQTATALSKQEPLSANSGLSQPTAAPYPGTCRALTQEQKQRLLLTRQPAKRILVPDSDIEFFDAHYGKQSFNLAQDCGDFIIRRADKNFAYQLAVVVDDALMGINQVVRGRDLLSSTPQQIFLYQKLGYAVPEFFHIPLIVNGQGRRLSKRDGDVGMDFLRTRYKPCEIIGRLMTAAGFLPKYEPLSLEGALEVFDPKILPKEDFFL